MPKTPKEKKITYIKKGTRVRVTNCIGKERVGIMEGCNDVLGHIILGDGFRLAFGCDAKIVPVSKNTPLYLCDYVIERDRFWDVVSGERRKRYKDAYYGEQWYN